MTITDVNETMCRMAGRPRNQLVGSSFPSYSTDPQCAAEGVRLTFQQRAVIPQERGQAFPNNIRPSNPTLVELRAEEMNP